MTYKHIGLVAAVALAANAFMIPSTVSAPEIKDDGIEALKAFDPSRMAHDDAAKDGGHLVKLECPGCKVEGAEDVPMSLVLNWTITAQGTVLSLNDVDFYSQKTQHYETAYTAPQMPSAVPDELTSFFTRADKISFFPDGVNEPVMITPQTLSLVVTKRQVSATDDTDDQLVDIDIRIPEVSSGGVAGVDSLNLRLLQDVQGHLNLLEIVRVPVDGSAAEDANEPSALPASAPHHKEEDQTFEILPVSGMPLPSAPNGEPIPAIRQRPAHIVNCHHMPLNVCKLQWLIRQKMAAMHRAFSAAVAGRPTRPHHRPCGKMGMMRPHSPNGLPLKGGVPKFTTPDGARVMRPEGMHAGHHHHHHGGKMHRCLRFLRRFFFGFLVPVMIGVAAGMTASLAGMVVGTGIAMLWFRLRRGSKKGSQGAGAVEEGDATEREGLIPKEEELLAEHRDSEDTLPAYEEKPSQTE